MTQTVMAATTAALPACTYYNGSIPGENSTLTANSNGAFPAIDGVTLVANDSLNGLVLVNSQSSQIENGLYGLIQQGDGSTPWILQRKAGAFSLNNTSMTGVRYGNTYGGTTWILRDAITTVGTDNIIFELSGISTDAQILFSDVTTNNATTSQHGFLKKLDNNAAHFMDGTGNWSTPPGGSLTLTGDVTGSGSGSIATTIASSVALAGSPTTTTQSPGDNSTKIATTAYVAAALSGAGGLQPHMTVFTSSGTFTTSANVTSSTVFTFTVVGGGGGGGGASSTDISKSAGGGGGAGATCTYVASGLSASTGYTITVGAAGSAGSSSGGNGGTGGTSSAAIGGTTATAAGGTGGAGGTSGGGGAAGSGGAATNGTINIPGGDGAPGIAMASAFSASGSGGASSLGGGGAGKSAAAGAAGKAYGSGGSGASGSATGGAGKAGIVIVEWQE